MKFPDVRYMRRCIFKPYRPGHGPKFRLTLWDATYAGNGRENVHYTLECCETKGWHVLFEGSDFSPPPHVSVDSDESVSCLMSFLTLRPEDTDPDYFAEYTPEQLAYCEQHAEALSLEVMIRFGELD